MNIVDSLHGMLRGDLCLYVVQKPTSSYLHECFLIWNDSARCVFKTDTLNVVLAADLTVMWETQPRMEAGRALEVHVQSSFYTLLRSERIGPAPSTFNLGKGWRWTVTITISRFTTGGKSPRYPQKPRPGTPQNQYEHFLPLLGIDSLVHPT
jgi:hypothetical protein